MEKTEFLSSGSSWGETKFSVEQHSQDGRKAQLRCSELNLNVSGRWERLGFAEKAVRLAKRRGGEHLSTERMLDLGP